jgi:hypothetical protein
MVLTSRSSVASCAVIGGKDRGACLRTAPVPAVAHDIVDASHVAWSQRRMMQVALLDIA